MDAPEYLICIDCETPCYTFEFADARVTEAECMACGADDPDQFLNQEDYEAMVDG